MLQYLQYQNNEFRYFGGAFRDALALKLGARAICTVPSCGYRSELRHHRAASTTTTNSPATNAAHRLTSSTWYLHLRPSTSTHTSTMPATTAETLSLVTRTVSVAPLVLLSAADHYGRQAKGTRKRVVGVLLGQNDGKNVRVSNSFAGA